MKYITSSLQINPYFRTLLLVVAFILPATVMRVALIIVYPEDFNGLGFWQILEALIVGLRFDVSIAALFIGFPLLFLLLPFQWSHHKIWQNFWKAYILVAWLLFILLLVVDTIYFGQVHRHIGSEIYTIDNDIGSMVSIAFTQYRIHLIVFALGSAVLIWLGWHWIKSIPPKPPRPWRRLLAWPLILACFVIAQRGNYSGKPIGVGEAFFSNSLSQGYLAMNGAFAISRAILEQQPKFKRFLPEDEAINITQEQLASPGSSFPEKEYPLFRKPLGKNMRNPNVVVLMLESWGALHIDAIRREMKLPPLGVTPNFDQLASQGRLFTKFYANGQRSIQGAAAILAGLPTMPAMPILGVGMEQNRLSFLGELAKSEKYKTIFLQSSDHGSFHFDAIASRAGFDEYRGAETIPNLHEKPKPPSTWGTWDHNTFQQAHKMFAASKKPFLGFIFTSTTHTPWLVPDDRWKKYNGGKDKDAFLNTLNYADWALGELIAAAKQDGYFDNTIFIITADHVSEFVEQPDYVPNQFHIPLLIVGPGIQPGIDNRIGSQIDIIPTLIDLTGWSTPYAGLGRSLVDNSRTKDRAAFTVRGDVIDWITDSGWISHNLDRSVGSANLTKDQESLSLKKLLSIYQTTVQLQLDNRLVPAKIQ